MSEHVDADLQQLIQSCMSSLETLGAEEGFTPYAVTLVDDGEGEGDLIGTAPDEDPSAMLGRLVHGLKQRAEESTLRAFAIVSDVTMTDSGTGKEADAIRIHLEHREVGALAVFAPYEMQGEERVLGDLQQGPSRPLIFGAAPPAEAEARHAHAREFMGRIPEFATLHIEKSASLAEVTLAYDESSFALNDRILLEGWGGERPSNPAIVVQLFGSFVGETIRKLHGGEWAYDEENGVVHLAGVGASDLRVFPFEAVVQRIEHGESASLEAYYRDLRESLGS